MVGSQDLSFESPSRLFAFHLRLKAEEKEYFRWVKAVTRTCTRHRRGRIPITMTAINYLAAVHCTVVGANEDQLGSDESNIFRICCQFIDVKKNKVRNVVFNLICFLDLFCYLQTPYDNFDSILR